MSKAAVEVLSQRGWLARQPAPFREQLMGLSELRSYRVGETLYAVDDRAGGVFGLVDGFVDVLLGVGPFPPFFAFVGRPGWWFGEAAVITNTARRAEVHARSPTRALYLPAHRVAEMAAGDAEAWRRFAELSVDHVDNALLLAAILNHADVREKVIATLWRLAGPERESDEMIELPCMQADVAELSGVSRNSAGPILRHLADEGLIEMRRGLIRYRPATLRKALD